MNWKNPKDRKKIYFQLISILLSIAIMILSSIISYDSEVAKSISDELIENFETGFFMDFKNESNGDEGNKVKFGEWQGTLKGCGIYKNNIKEAVKLEEGEICENGEKIEAIHFQYIYKYKGITLYSSTKGKYIDLLYDETKVFKEKKIVLKEQ